MRLQNSVYQLMKINVGVDTSFCWLCVHVVWAVSIRRQNEERPSYHHSSSRGPLVLQAKGYASLTLNAWRHRIHIRELQLSSLQSVLALTGVVQWVEC